MRTFSFFLVMVFLWPEAVFADQSLDSLLADKNRTKLFTWCFPGGEIPPATMHFWSNGLLEVNWEVTSARRKTDHFAWSRPSNPTEVRLQFIDTGVDFETFLSFERTHDYVAGYDTKARAIIYKTVGPTHEAMFFGGWRFDRALCGS